MSLSINKLEKILSDKGFLSKKFFTIDGMCIYIEVINLQNCDTFMLYIPSKYNIPVDRKDNTFKVEYLDIDEEGNITSDYAGEPDNFELEKAYEEDIDLDSENANKKNMKEFLEEKYNHPVTLKDMTKDDAKEIRQVFRQLKRLRFCVKNITYKLCIAFKNYLCCLRKDDTLEGFIVPKMIDTSNRKLYVKLDLETLYSNIATLGVDIKTVKEGVYKVLDKNQNRHKLNMQKLIDYSASISTISDVVLVKKEKFNEYLRSLEMMLEKLREQEKIIHQELTNAQTKYIGGSSGVKSYHTDLEKSHVFSKHENELMQINMAKQEIMKNIMNIKSRHENMLLKSDKIFFDNIIMIDEVTKNLLSLQSL